MSTTEAPKEKNAKTNGAAPAHNTLAKALVAAQKEMPAVKPDGTNPHFKSQFVTLGHLIAKARPVINRHGIAVTQFPSTDSEGKPTLVTILMHESGETLQFDAPLFLSKSDPQGQGSAITYMRRYALASALGISDQEDDDGNAGSQTKDANSAPKKATAKNTISQATAQALLDTAKAANVDGQRLSMWLTSQGVGHATVSSQKTALEALGRLTPDQAGQINDWLHEQGQKAPEVAA